MDGIGALCLLHQMLTALAEPRTASFGNELKNLSPGFFDVAGVQTDVTPEIQQTTTGLLTDLVSSQPSLGLPTIASNQIPGPTHHRDGQLKCKQIRSKKDRQRLYLRGLLHWSTYKATIEEFRLISLFCRS